MPVSPVFFETFTEMLAEGEHDLDGDTLAAYLSNTTPSASADALKEDLAEISTGNGYSGPVDLENATSRSGSTTSITVVDKTITAAGGSVGPFRYVVVMNDSTTGDMLVLYYDYGSAVTLQDGEEFELDLPASIFDIALDS